MPRSKKQSAAVIAAKKAASRNQESANERKARLEAVRLRVDSARCRETSVQREVRLSEQATRSASARSRESSTDRRVRLCEQATRSASVRSRESSTDRRVRLYEQATRSALGRSTESSADRQSRLLDKSLRSTSARSKESSTDRRVRLCEQATRSASVRSRESSTDRRVRLYEQATRSALGRSTESSADRQSRLLDKSLRSASARSKESSTDRQIRLCEQATRSASARSRESSQVRRARLQASKTISNTSRISQEIKDGSFFVNFQKGMSLKLCSQCSENFFDIKVIENRCQRCIKYREKLNPFSVDNNMDPGPQPVELKNLSFIEEQLIARVHPVISVYKLKGGQFGYSGQVINFPQNVNDIATSLPRRLSSLSNIVVFRRETANSHADFNVDREKVLAALLYLKQNNIYYADIELDHEALNELPPHENVQSLLTSSTIEEFGDPEDYGVVSTDAISLPPGNQVAQIQQGITNEGPFAWPTISSTPINEFATVGYLAMAFPSLFPTGAADLRAPRQETVNPAEYFRHLMRYRDSRFSTHPRFRFLAMNSTQRWSALKQGSICVRKNSELNNKTVEDLRLMLQETPSLSTRLLSFNSSIRGTSSYWYARSQELISFVDYLGLPTLFFTLSAADMQWPELYRMISPDMDFGAGSNIETFKKRGDLLNANPHIAAWFFKERADFFITKILCQKFHVRDYWYRYEFQHRGSPHIHGILYIEGAPDVSNLDSASPEELTRIAQYFDELISTVNPDVNSQAPLVHPCRQHYTDIEDHDEDYNNLINCCQRHTRHGPGCLKKKRDVNIEECRFKFPFPLKERTELIKTDGKWELQTARNDPLINKHNRFITEHWRANTDVQAIVSQEALTRYIAKYSSKAEPQSKTLESILQEVLCNESDDNKSAKSAIQKIFTRICAERDYSAQESFHILMGWPLYHCSRTFVHLNVQDDQWVPILGGVETSSVLADQYPAQPVEFKDMSMIQYFSELYKHGSRYVRRKKPAVVRVLPKLKQYGTNSDQYYRQQVITRIPWRRLSDFDTMGTHWKAIYECRLQDLLPSVEDTRPDLSDDDYESGEEQQMEILDDWMLESSLGPNEVGIVELGMRPQDVNFDWTESFASYENATALPSFIDQAKQVDNTSVETLSMPNVPLSSGQKRVLDLVRQQLDYIIRETENYPPQNVIVQGKAGSGKSTVVSAMTYTIHESLGNDSYLLAAPTGAAAVNIGGSTLHSALQINIDKTYKPLNNENLKALQLKLRSCRFLIIDEMSMVGCSLLKKIDYRCREGRPDEAHKPFGGIFVYLLGDIKQLPPVLDRPVYGTSFKGPLHDQGQLLFRTFERCVVLTSCHRQQGSSQENFRCCLDRLSVGKSSVDDWRLLMSREKSSLPPSEVDSFKDAIRLFPTNAKVSSYNVSKLSRLNSAVALIKAQHNNLTATKGSMEEAQGLDPKLYLAKGARVMLKTNLWTSSGLVNGALGTVNDIIYSPSTSPPHDPPIAVTVRFDKYQGPSINGIVPIAPLTRTWMNGGVSCSRTQFPLTLAWSVTIHKSQGLTLDKAVVDIGDTELAPGCTYVALSRVKELSGLLFDPGFNFDCLTRISLMKLLSQRILEEERLNSLSNSIIDSDMYQDLGS